MTKYVLLYRGGGMPVTEAEQVAVLKQWEAWYGELGPALVDAGNPFTPMAKRIGSDGMVKDEPRETMASGYTIINADSLDAAARMAKGCPIVKSGGTITVYETFTIG